MTLRGRVVIVTGASAGVGRAYALALAEKGATVVAGARRLQRGPSGRPSLAALVEEAGPLRGEIHAYRCDVEREEQVVGLVDHTVANFGRVDGLVNNAAYLWQADSLDVPVDVWDRMMATNVRAPYVAIREAAPIMISQAAGSIVNITAGAGALSREANHPRMLPYAVTKAALNRLSHYMAAELKRHGVAVNSLSPGVVASEAAINADPDAATTETHKPATPEVLGPALLHLVSQTGVAITGKVLHTDDFGKTWP